MAPVAPVLDLVGAVGFLGAFVYAVRLYRRGRLLGNYWLVAATGSGLLGVWAVVEALEGLGFAPGLFESRLQILLLTAGLTAVLLLALYDNTEGESLLRRLETSERRTSAIVERFPAGGVALVDGEFECLLAGGQNLFGEEDPERLEGAHLPGAFDEPLRTEVTALVRTALSGRSTTAEVVLEDGTYQARSLPVDEAGDDRTCLLVVRDVTAERQRERALSEQADELETLARINRVIRSVDRALVSADSREEIERAVCDRLVAGGPYEFALVSEREGGDRFVPRVWSDGADEYVETVFPLELDDPSASPGMRAVETGDIQVVQNVEADETFGPWRETALGQNVRAVASVPVRYGERTFGVLAVYADRPNAFDERERDVLTQFGETLGHALTAVERKERADVLTALHGVTRELLHAETVEEVCDVVLAAGRDLLDVEIAVFEYDAAAAVLEPVASTPDALSFYGDKQPRYTGETESVTWEVYASGETVAFDDIRNAENLDVEDTDARGVMFMPLGEHGLFAAGSTEIGAFDEQTRKLVELLAATTEAAFDRLESDRSLRERERELDARNRQLERLQRLNDVIREIDQALVGAATRAEIEQTVCDRMTADDRCLFAWVGVDDGGVVTPRAWAGTGAGYLDDIDPTGSARGGTDASAPDGDGEGDADAGGNAIEPAVRTLQTGDPTIVSALSEHVRETDWGSEAVARGFRSALGVPLRYGGITYGVLTLYSGSTDSFDEETVAVLGELGETVGHAIDAVETKRGLHATAGTELELVVRGAVSFLNDVAALGGGPVACIEAVPEGGGRTRVHFRAPGVSFAKVRELAGESVTVERVDRPGGRTDEHTFRATVDDDTVSEAVVDSGAVPDSVEMTTEETRLVVSLLPHVDARTFVERLTERYDDVELVARRERGEERTRSAFLDEFESELTDRQREVLRRAYESGYFETPRESSGQDVADRLGISQPTVNHHLREGQRRLLSLLFQDAEEASPKQSD